MSGAAQHPKAHGEQLRGNASGHTGGSTPPPGAHETQPGDSALPNTGGASRQPQAPTPKSVFLAPLAVTGVLAPNELEAMLAIERQAHPTPWSDRAFAQSTGPGYELTGLFVLPPGASPINEVQMVGFTLVHQVAGERTLMNIAVAPQYQGRGLGERLLKAALERACDEQGQVQDTFFLEVREHSHRAIGLYKKMGFTPVGRRPGYYPPVPPETEREAALVMRLG